MKRVHRVRVLGTSLSLQSYRFYTTSINKLFMMLSVCIVVGEIEGGLGADLFQFQQSNFGWNHDLSVLTVTVA